jgi:very-short-patch-repair endonuclease
MAGKRHVAKLFTTHPETGLERTVRYELERLGVAFQKEYRVGRYTVDFLVGDTLVVEADGGAWHPDAAKNPYGFKKLAKAKLRDAYLKSQGLSVLHFDEKQIRSGLFREPLAEAIGVNK